MPQFDLLTVSALRQPTRIRLSVAGRRGERKVTLLIAPADRVIKAQGKAKAGPFWGAPFLASSLLTPLRRRRYIFRYMCF